MKFDIILKKLDQKCHFVIIDRKSRGRDTQYLEIGFSTSGNSPNYFLWILVEYTYIPYFIEKYDLQKQV